MTNVSCNHIGQDHSGIDLLAHHRQRVLDTGGEWANSAKPLYCLWQGLANFRARNSNACPATISALQIDGQVFYRVRGGGMVIPITGDFEMVLSIAQAIASGVIDPNSRQLTCALAQARMNPEPRSPGALSDRRLATIRAALQLYHDSRGSLDVDVEDLASGYGSIEPLNIPEITVLQHDLEANLVLVAHQSYEALLATFQTIANLSNETIVTEVCDEAIAKGLEIKNGRSRPSEPSHSLAFG
ncbi:MAG: hypothetical protein ACHWZW_02715 [Spirulina sp.]